ncbi:MAG: restriction endonuclease [Legionella sp.]|nr:restriction endonuclease [Legionella sp.]
MALLSGTAAIECTNCQNLLLIDASDLDIDQVGSDERQMGAEIFYSGDINIVCPKCNNDIKLGYEASEYPIGVPNFSDTNAYGARVIRGFADIDVHFDDQFYSFEEESQLYLPEEKKIITNFNSSISELIIEINKKPASIYDLNPRKFEELIAHIFYLHGFNVELTKQTRDGGRDIIAIQSTLGMKTKFIIECKRYAANNPISVDLVRALYGVQMHEGANKSVLATTSRFTQDAKNFATEKNKTEWLMDLKDINDIRGWIGAAVNNKPGAMF